MRRLQAERQRLGLSQFQLGKLADVHPAEISRLERGRIYPYPGWRRKLAEALGWPVESAEELFEEVQE
ncbi:MAG: helix-turn-helix domain-containing protein [Dethiobacteraceae bacterium]